MVIAADKNRVMDGLKNRLANWSGLLIVLFGVVTFIALGAWLVHALRSRMPQRNVVMSIYPEGSVNAELVKRYREILARKGIDLKLVASAGAVESVARLRDPNSAISVALVPGGVTTEQDSPELISLGSLFYQPVWVFSRVIYSCKDTSHFKASVYQSAPRAVARMRSPSSFSDVAE